MVASVHQRLLFKFNENVTLTEWDNLISINWKIFKKKFSFLILTEKLYKINSIYIVWAQYNTTQKKSNMKSAGIDWSI
jgi:hypothetical protein